MERLFLVTYDSQQDKAKAEALPLNVNVIYEEHNASNINKDAVIQLISVKTTPRPNVDVLPLPQRVLEFASLVCEIRRGCVEVFKSRPTIRENLRSPEVPQAVEEASSFLGIFNHLHPSSNE